MDFSTTLENTVARLGNAAAGAFVMTQHFLLKSGR